MSRDESVDFLPSLWGGRAGILGQQRRGELWGNIRYVFRMSCERLKKVMCVLIAVALVVGQQLVEKRSTRHRDRWWAPTYHITLCNQWWCKSSGGVEMKRIRWSMIVRVIRRMWISWWRRSTSGRWFTSCHTSEVNRLENNMSIWLPKDGITMLR